MPDEPENKPPQIIIYETDDKVARVSVRLDDESVWLTNAQLAQLFQVSKSTVSEHIKNIFESAELSPDAVVRNFRTTAADGKTYRCRRCQSRTSRRKGANRVCEIPGEDAQRCGEAVSGQHQRRRSCRKKEEAEVSACDGPSTIMTDRILAAKVGQAQPGDRHNPGTGK
jgi:hypothetical protein